MRNRPPRIAVAGSAPEVSAVAREIAALAMGRAVLIASSPGEAEELTLEALGSAVAGGDLGAVRGCDLVVLAGDWTRGGDLGEAASCVARYAPEAVVVAAAERSVSLARAFLGRSRLAPRQVLALGGLPELRARAAALASRLGVDSSQVSLLAAGGEEDQILELRRYRVVAGIPAAMLERAMLPPGTPPPLAGREAPSLKGVAPSTAVSLRRRARAAALIAGAVLQDRRRILCCGVHLEATHGLPTIFATLPAIIGRSGCEGIFPAALTLEERSFLQEAAAPA